MNGIPLLVFGAAILSPSPWARAAARPECEEWYKAVTASINLDGGAPAFLPGKEKADLLRLLSAFPDEHPFTVDRVSKSNRDTIADLIGRPGCKTMTYWSLHKWGLTDPAFDPATRKKFIKELIDRTLREEDGEPAFISLTLRIRLFQLAIENGTLKVSDPAYFAFSRQLTEVDRLAAELREDHWDRIPKSCVEEDTLKPKNCPDEVFEPMLKHLQREMRMTTALRRELVRWVRRAARN